MVFKHEYNFMRCLTLACDLLGAFFVVHKYRMEKKFKFISITDNRQQVTANTIIILNLKHW